jgi:hypothetical protein
MAIKAKWITRGTFNCTTGRTKGFPFDVDGRVLEQVTEYAASNDCNATVRNDVRIDNSERRLTIVLEVAG